MKGVWRPGERLEALRLADELGVSMTPVRDCLNRLVGERLVDMKPGDGYHVPRLNEKALRDLFAFNAALLELALFSDSESILELGARSQNDIYADCARAFFDGIASYSANSIISETILSLNDRLHLVRMQEPRVFPDALHELAELEQSAVKKDGALLNRLQSYHNRRRDNVSALIDHIQ